MEDIEEDKIANQILDELPPSFMVFGSKKELDPLEEFWMNKLSNIEKQYDLHIVDLERKLLSDRSQRRTLKKQTTKIVKLEEVLQEQTEEIERLRSKTGIMSEKLKQKAYEVKSLHDKHERVDIASKSISQRLQDERQARRQYEKECTELRNKLKVLEKEKAQLRLDVEIKESEKGNVEEREAALSKEKWSLIHNLTELDTERSTQTNANLKLCHDMEKLLNVEKSLEVSLLKERKVMGEMMEEMRHKKHEHNNALRQLDIAIKEKRDTQLDLEHSVKRNVDLDRNVKHLKEELQFNDLDNSTQCKEIKDLKRRNSRVRCILADTNQKLNICLSDMKSLENEKRRADVELQTARRHEKALHVEMRKNELRKYKLADKILKAHPFLLKRDSDERTSRSSTADQHTRRNEIESYKRKIWSLERHRDEVERKLRELQRKENVYRMKLDKYKDMEKQIFWTGKAMAKLEGDRNRLEALLKTMESNMPMKVPFRKLVTDPSVLDRLAKNKILQKRIFQQAEKIEELKSNARRILHYREEQFGAMNQLPDEVPSWKLSYWYRNQVAPENVFSGMHLDVMRQQPGSIGRLSAKPLTDSEHYKNYVQYLDDEIPRLRDEIRHLEKKKLYNQTEKEARIRGKKRSIAENIDRMKLSGQLGDDEQPAAEVLEIGENDGDDNGQCTPELSIHGSSFDNRKAGRDQNKQDVKKTPSIQKQAAHIGSSSTEDERDDVSSGDAVSDIPSDQSIN
ncbi:unnamed protein product [Orchesella dallaii]|uniref:Uncharacterized protein n=1 Tax=Orchesella dallaii TaxID=48710 RepID=A0ABP1PYC7_9HEXA